MKKWKRVIAVLCALVCVLGMSVSVFAVTYSCVPMPDMKGLLSCIDAEAGVYSVDLSQVLKNTGYVASLNDKWTLLQKDLEDGKDFYTVRYFSFKDHPLGLVICFIPKTANISLSGSNVVLNTGQEFLYTFAFNAFSSGFFHHGSGYKGNYDAISPSGEFIYFYSDDSKAFFENIGFDLDVKFWDDLNELRFAIDDENVVPPVSRVHTLTVNYQYENGTQAAQPVTRSLTAGSSYEIASPIIEGYTADRPIVSGTMPEEDLTVTVTYTAVPPPEPQTYNLTVNYRYENGSQAAQSLTRSLTAGSSYEITSPTIEGYTADRPIVSGTMPEEDLTVTVTYTAVPPPEPQTYNLTINYRYENGSQAVQPVTRSLTAGSSYEITSPAIEGYTADKPVVSGTMPAEDLTVTVTYTAVPPPEPQTYTLTVNYRYENGSQAAQPITRSLTAGSSYEITSPTIKNYTADRVVVSGIMPERDLTVHVLYRKDSSGSSSSSGKFPDVAAGVEWKDPLTWFDIAEGVEWKDPLTWFDIAEGVEWKDPLTWFDIAEGVDWIDPFNYDWG